jgi:hypothetical protein
VAAIEANVEGVWFAKQSAKGSPATAPSTAGTGKRIRKVGGDLNVNRDDASEAFSDGNRFSTASDFVNAIRGEGAPVAQGQSGVLAYLAYLMLGQETVTGSSAPYTHVATPNTAGSFWSTWWKRVGSSVVQRQKFNDCKLVSLRIEGSSASKVLHVTPTFVSLDAGEVFTADPTLVDDGTDPLLYTEAVGTFTIDGQVVKGHSAFAVVISDSVTPWYGDDVTAEDVVYGQGTISIEGVTLLVNQAGKDQYDRIVYGTTSPPAGTKPIKKIGALGSYSFDVARGTSEEFKVEIPGVHWHPDVAIAGNPSGGAVELALAADVRAVAGQPMIRITSKCADPAYT